MADGKDTNRVRIHDLVTARPPAIPAATSIRDAAEATVRTGFRQLPVVGEADSMGIVDIADVCGALLGLPLRDTPGRQD